MSRSNRTGYLYAGDIDVKQALLVSQTGQIIDIMKLVLEYNFFQSLHEHYMQCDIVVQDALGVLDSLKGDSRAGLAGGFTGGEMLFVKFEVPGNETQVLAFAIYELTERQRVDEKIESYLLSGISPEAYFASVKKISRAYGPNTIDKMIRSITDEFVYSRQIKDLYRSYRQVTNCRIDKDVFFRETNGLQKYVIPNMSVDATIDMLAREADCLGHAPYFLYYEDFLGFKFEDVNNLVQEDVSHRFTYLPTIGNEADKETEDRYRDSSKIIDYTVQKQSNILQNAQGGLFRSKTINVDILRKNKTESVFNYEKEHSRFNTLQKFKIPGQVTGDPLIFMTQSRNNHDQDNIFRSERPYPKKINRNLGSQSSYKRHLFNTVLEVTVPGDETLYVGRTIYLEIPVATTLNKKDGQQDKYLSGKYLVTKVRHQIKKSEQFFTYIECAKDTGIEI